MITIVIPILKIPDLGIIREQSVWGFMTSPSLCTHDNIGPANIGPPLQRDHEPGGPIS